MRLYLIATQIVYFVTLIPWLILWAMAFIVISHASDMENAMLFSFLSIYPVVVIASSIIAWYFHSNKPFISLVLGLIPSIWIVYYLIA
nr:hypothetical protein [Lysinibacillus timonensis]